MFAPSACVPETVSLAEEDWAGNGWSRMFDIKEHARHDREEVERFIRRCFASAYGADLRNFMPRLFSLRARDGSVIAAFGVREAAREALFLESYLDRPIECTLQQRVGMQVARSDIVEVGNLSGIHPGAVRWLIVTVTELLHREGFRWVSFTGTTKVRNGFRRLGLKPVELSAATLAHLPERERSAWGSYYAHAPAVMAGNVAEGYRALLVRGNRAQLLRAGIGTVKDEGAA